jgi:hypothetical protein
MAIEYELLRKLDEAQTSHIRHITTPKDDKALASYITHMSRLKNDKTLTTSMKDMNRSNIQIKLLLLV